MERNVEEASIQVFAKLTDGIFTREDGNPGNMTTGGSLFAHELDGGAEVWRISEDACVTQINDLLNAGLQTKETAQSSGIIGAQPAIAADVGQPPAGTKQAQALTKEIHEEVCRAVIGVVMILVKRFVLAQLLLAHIGRIADYRIKTCVLASGRAVLLKEDIGKLQFPVKEAFSAAQFLGALEDLRVMLRSQRSFCCSGALIAYAA